MRGQERPLATGSSQTNVPPGRAHRMSQEAGASPFQSGDSHQPGDVGHSEYPLIRHTDPVVDGEVVFLGRYKNKG